MNKIIIAILLIPMIGFTQGKNAETIAVNKSTEASASSKIKKGRIEKVVDKNGVIKSIKLISSAGKIKKELPVKYYWHAKMSDNNRLLYVPKNYFEEEMDNELRGKGYLSYPVKIYDEEGNMKLDKEIKVYPKYAHMMGVDEFYYDISKDGSRAYIDYANNKSSYTLVVYNIASGKEVLRLEHDFLLSDIEISPDGKIVGGETRKDSEPWKYFYFIEVDSGKTKLVKASGENWRGGVILSSGGPLILNKVLIWLEGDKIKYQRFYISFSDLPDDISELFIEGKNK